MSVNEADHTHQSQEVDLTGHDPVTDQRKKKSKVSLAHPQSMTERQPEKEVIDWINQAKKPAGPSLTILVTDLRALLGALELNEVGQRASHHTAHEET